MPMTTLQHRGDIHIRVSLPNLAGGGGGGLPHQHRGGICNNLHDIVSADWTGDRPGRVGAQPVLSRFAADEDWSE